MEILIKDSDYYKEPEICPKCNSSDMSADNMNFDGFSGWRNVVCNNCEFSWTEEYRFWKWESNEDLN